MRKGQKMALKNNFIFKLLRWPRINRLLKDTTFRRLFNDKKRLLELYNALNHSNYDDPNELIINTLDNAIYLGYHNDLSFIIDTSLNLYEHQSTICPNIPLRCLFYVSSLYSQIIDENELYREKRLSIPAPHFVVFYNGEKEFPEEVTYKLSDLYAGASDELELTVRVLNIHQGNNSELMKNSKTLRDYAFFNDKIQQYKKNRPEKKAVDDAIDYCIKHDILKDFLEKERRAIIMYSLFEYNFKSHMNSIREEALEDGITIGEERGIAIGEERGIAIGEERGIAIGEERGVNIGKAHLINKMLSKGKSPEEIAELTDVPLEDILKYSK